MVPIIDVMLILTDGVPYYISTIIELTMRLSCPI